MNPGFLGKGEFFLPAIGPILLLSHPGCIPRPLKMDLVTLTKELVLPDQEMRLLNDKKLDIKTQFSLAYPPFIFPGYF